MLFVICVTLLAVLCLIACEVINAYCDGAFEKKPKTWRDRLGEEGDPNHCRRLHSSWSHGDGGSDNL